MPRASLRKPPARRRAAFTLVELLVATTVTLIMVFALVQMFELIGRHAARGRAMLELSGQLRGVAIRLREDLQGVTVPVRPWAQGGAASGYFEYYEGVDRDAGPAGAAGLAPPANTVVGDRDDVLMFTTRSRGRPFLGQVQILAGGNLETRTIQSAVAEVVWYMTFDRQTQEGVLYRRALLIRPDLNSGGVFRTIPYSTSPDGLRQLRDALVSFFNQNDLSVRIRLRQSGGNRFVDLIANSLADLANRRNRFAHRCVLIEVPQQSGPPTYLLAPNSSFPYPQWSFYPQFPYPLDTDRFNLQPDEPRSPTSLQQLALNGGLTAGQHVMLSHALAFDVRAYDPYAPVAVDDKGNPTEALTPGDPAWSLANEIARGAYVDLNYANNPNLSPFSGPPAFRDLDGDANHDPGEPWLSGLTRTRATYDTWTIDYEHDGVNQDGDTVDRSHNGVDDDQNGQVDDAGEANLPLVDEGANGLDDDGQVGVDDVGERETSPPYPAPLRSIEVRIRVIEPATRQIRQQTLVADFTPE